ncbi:MAG: hypothetical protein DRQ88_03615 [Epsilonproteobacteria bacterium]|nr:MAG: hypothetical protein DRQ89_03875 [Campylobacterota bacterium]RLA67262.1 MAG: hypothetical protein DRQ88_03615 [Campylobacterota bacterium]
MKYKTIVILFLLFSSSANSQVNKILNESNDGISLDFQKRSSRYTGGYRLKNEIFKVASSTMNKNEFNEFRKWYYGTFFYDMNRTIRWNLKGQYPKVRYFTGYDKKGDRPLEGYITTKEFTKSFKAMDVNPKILARIQRTLLHRKSIFTKKLKVAAQDMAYVRNSEGAKDKELDKKRNYAVHYNMGFELDKFHRTVGARSHFRNLKWSKPTNPFVSFKFKKTIYLNPLDNFNYKDCLRRKILKETCLGIKKHLPDYKSMKYGKGATKHYQDWLIGYVDEALRELKISLKNARTNWDVIKAAAYFHHSLVSIHPFGNGNGRTTRVMTEKILEDYNLPPQIGYPFGVDVTFSRSDFATIVGDGVALSKKFHEDLLVLLKNNIPYSYVSSHYLAPGLLPWKMIGTTKLIPKEYMAWLMQYTSKASNTMDKWSYSQTDSIKEFINWRKKANQKTLNMFYNITKLAN